MEKKNQKLTIIVGCLLLVISVSLAYFVGSVLINGTGSRGNVTTARINGSVLSVEGILEFNDTNILPGHKSVSSIKVTATGEPVLIPYNLIWKGTNNLGTKLNYTVYKTTENINVSATCEEKRSSLNGYTVLSEECTITNLNNLGNIISSGSINTSTSETKVTISSDEFITSSKSGEIVYYYVILEYPNLNEDQSSDMGGTFEGEVTVEESHASADINILGVYLEQSDGTYKQVDNVPNKESNYTLNESKSTCTNNAKPRWNREEWALEVGSLSQSGTECNIYFDGSKTIAQVINKYEKSDARSGAISGIFSEYTPNTIYSVADGSTTSYVFAGENPNNYVKFGGYYWRIVRFNGDGTLRLIYNGPTTEQIGNSTIIGSSVYNDRGDSIDNAYVGYMYGALGSSSYEDTHANINDSKVKQMLDEWYKNNIANNESYSSKIDLNAGFCNNRTVKSGTGAGTNWTEYIADSNIVNGESINLECSNNNDFFTSIESIKGNKTLKYPVGLLTAEEAILIGLFGSVENNESYLNNGYANWTMTPYVSTNWIGISYFGRRLGAFDVSGENGIRPVINLRSDIKLSGNGTMNDPYEVI